MLFLSIGEVSWRKTNSLLVFFLMIVQPEATGAHWKVEKRGAERPMSTYPGDGGLSWNRRESWITQPSEAFRSPCRGARAVMMRPPEGPRSQSFHGLTTAQFLHLKYGSPLQSRRYGRRFLPFPTCACRKDKPTACLPIRKRHRLFPMNEGWTLYKISSCSLAGIPVSLTVLKGIPAHWSVRFSKIRVNPDFKSASGQ